MALLRRRPIASIAALAAVGLVVAIGVVASIASGGTPRWTFQGEHFATVRESFPGSGGTRETVSTARIWFSPGNGWRMEVDSDTPDGRRHRIFGTDGATNWNIDPLSNRYTMSADGVVDDPRAVLAVMMATAGTRDSDAAIAALRRIQDVTVTEESSATILGRPVRVVTVSPYSCGETGSVSTSGETSRERRCAGHVRYWLDQASGWVLKAEADDGRGGGFTWETRSATFDQPIDPSLFRLTPPPGSIEVDSLD